MSKTSKRGKASAENGGSRSQQRVVRLPRRVSTWLRKWKKNEDAKVNAIRRQDFEAAAAYIKMKRSFADLICSELAKQPNSVLSVTPKDPNQRK